MYDRGYINDQWEIIIIENDITVIQRLDLH